MSWIGLADQAGGRFSATGLGGDTRPSPALAAPDNPEALLATGTLLLETRLSSNGRLQTLLQMHRSHPFNSGLSLQALPQGGIVLIQTQGQEVQHVTLPYRPNDRTDTLRIGFSWDAPRRWGQLTLERPESDVVHSIAVPSPHPLWLADLRTMITDARQRRMDKEVDFIAVSSRIEPVGPMPGLTGHLPVSTPTGFRDAGHLRRGDTVHTDGAGAVPVLHTVSRTVPARGSFRPVRLRAPYFGLRQDVTVAPEQRLVIQGSKVEYMFGQEAVLVPARHLINGVAAAAMWFEAKRKDGER